MTWASDIVLASSREGAHVLLVLLLPLVGLTACREGGVTLPPRDSAAQDADGAPPRIDADGINSIRASHSHVEQHSRKVSLSELLKRLSPRTRADSL